MREEVAEQEFQEKKRKNEKKRRIKDNGWKT